MSKPGLTQPEDPTPPQDARSARAPRGQFSRARKARWSVCVALGCAVLAFGILRSGSQEKKSIARPAATQTSQIPRFPVSINRPRSAPEIATGFTNFHGEPVLASCASCHTTTKPNLETRSAADLDQFHQGLKYTHGNLTCLSCHNAGDYETLRLADGRSLGFEDSMSLCSQCHGPQRRDYDRGLHGGMNGYWDLARGGRTRNTCIDCHDPHSPAFPAVLPVLAPRDRISVVNGEHSKSTQQSSSPP